MTALPGKAMYEYLTIRLVWLHRSVIQGLRDVLLASSPVIRSNVCRCREFHDTRALIRTAAPLLGLLLALTSCAHEPNARDYAQRRAVEQAGMQRIEIQTDVFPLVSYARMTADAAVLRVYIEGDGHAWRRQDEPSDDPTPWNPMGLVLATLDPSTSVAYLARPCQYIAPGSDPHCAVEYWTTRRYAEPVIESANAAIDRLMAAGGARTIELVGFSGGGAVAARRYDVANLRTVAANLDTAAWTERNGTTPLFGSLNPADFANSLDKLPQLHFVGVEDNIVEMPILRAYRDRFAKADCVAVSAVPGVDHLNGWTDVWPALLGRSLRCGR